MNRNEQLARQMRQIFNDICRHFHPNSSTDSAEDQFIRRSILESMLACPLQEEIPNSLNLLSLNRESLTLPGYRSWDLNNESKMKILSINLKQITPQHLSPHRNETVVQTYRRLSMLKTRKEVEYYAEHIKALRTLIFEKTGCNSAEQNHLITYWINPSRQENPPPKSKKFKPPTLKGRRKNAEAIDICTASRIILYFIEAFIAKPYKIQYGAATCFLWFMIRLTLYKTVPVIRDILNLKIENLRLKNDQLYINDIEIAISKGLFQLLSILIHARPKSEPVFCGITSDWLQDQFAKASKSLGENQRPVLPSAFHSFPHLHAGYRIPQELIHARRQKLIPFKQYFYKNNMLSSPTKIAVL